MFCVSSDWRQRSSSLHHVKHRVWTTDRDTTLSTSIVNVALKEIQWIQIFTILQAWQTLNPSLSDKPAKSLKLLPALHIQIKDDRIKFASSPGVNRRSCPEDGLCGCAITVENEVEVLKHEDDEEERSVNLWPAGGGRGGGSDDEQLLSSTAETKQKPVTGPSSLLCTGSLFYRLLRWLEETHSGVGLIRMGCCVKY